MFQPLRMPVLVYEEVHSLLFPLPIPKAKPRDDTCVLHYMSFEENMTMPVTDEHQPSKTSNRLASSKKKSLACDTTITSNPGRCRGRVRVRCRGLLSRSRGSTGSVPPSTFVPLSSTFHTVKRKNFPLSHLSRLRDVVRCMEGEKPR
jgi:hypothetical protein